MNLGNLFAIAASFAAASGPHYYQGHRYVVVPHHRTVHVQNPRQPQPKQDDFANQTAAWAKKN